jgi:excisionase family DNA binding protein
VREYRNETATDCKFGRMTNQNNPRQPDMTIRQVAEFLNLHPETVRIMARQGQFPGAYKLGNATTAQIRIPWQTVEDYRKRQPNVSK